MIKYVKRKDLNIEKYDACVAKSLQSNIYGYSWYLDIACDNWDVLVLGDYNAVMPIPFRKKYGIRYVYPPLWVLQLGIFSLDKNIYRNDFIIELKKNFRFVELRLNTNNLISNHENNVLKNQMQILSLKEEYNFIFKNYNRNRKRELIKAKKHGLIEVWNDQPIKLINLFKENIAKRVKGISEQDYINLEKLIYLCFEKKVGELLTIYSTKNELVSAAFFIKYKNKVTQIVCATDLNNRDNGANTFSNDKAIFKYQKHFDVYDFGGSSMKSIARYYKSFGAKTEEYQHIKYNNLPFVLKLFKK